MSHDLQKLIDLEAEARRRLRQAAAAHQFATETYARIRSALQRRTG
jgi:hypothetical protein